MKKLLLATAFATLGTAALAQDVVRIGTEGGLEPFNYIDQATGELTGFEIELGNELCTRAGLTCEWVANAWDSIIPNLQSGNYDLIMAGMTVTDERKQSIDFTEDYYPPAPSSFVALTDDVTIGDGTVVAVQTGTIQAGYIAEQEGLVMLEYATPDEAVAAARNGEADVAIHDKDYLLPFTGEGQELVMLDADVLIGDGIGAGVRKSDTELKDKFNAAIQSMKADGSLNAMIKKWFGEDAIQY